MDYNPRDQEQRAAIVKLTTTIRPTETRILQVEADDYETAIAQIEVQVPEGWQILTTTK